MDARVGPAGIPPIEIRLRLVECLEARALEWRLLGVPDARFDFALPIRIAHAARQGDDAVMREYVAIERIQGWVVDVGRKHALSQIVEDDHTDRAAQSTKCALMELRPRLRA
jgi:hypothetical protein